MGRRDAAQVAEGLCGWNCSVKMVVAVVLVTGIEGRGRDRASRFATCTPLKWVERVQEQTLYPPTLPQIYHSLHMR